MMRSAAGRAGWVALLAVAAGAGVVGYHYIARADQPAVVHTAWMRDLGRELRARLGAQADRVIFTETPYTLQFYMNTMNIRQSYDAAAAALAGDDHARVATNDPDAVIARMPATARPRVRVFAQSPPEDAPLVTILTNQPVE